MGKIWGEGLSTHKSQWGKQLSNDDRIEKQDTNQTTVCKSDYCSQMLSVFSFKVFKCEPSCLGGDKKGKEEGGRKGNILFGIVN